MGKENELSLHFASISGKKVEADFDGGRLTSDGGVVHHRAVDTSIGLIERLCDCISDDRHPFWIRQRCWLKIKTARFGFSPLFPIKPVAGESRDGSSSKPKSPSVALILAKW